MNLGSYLIKVIFNTALIFTLTYLISLSVQYGISHFITKNNWLRLIIVGCISSLALISLFVITNFKVEERKEIILRLRSILQKCQLKKI